MTEKVGQVEEAPREPRQQSAEIVDWQAGVNRNSCVHFYCAQTHRSAAETLEANVKAAERSHILEVIRQLKGEYAEHKFRVYIWETLNELSKRIEGK